MNAGFSHDARIAFFETPQGILAIDTRDGSRVPISLRGALDWLSANDRWAISGGTLVDLGADFDFPAQHVPLLLEVLTGTQLDEGGSVHFLSAQDWSRKRTEYKTIAEGHLGQCRFRHSNAYVRQQAVWSRLK